MRHFIGGFAVGLALALRFKPGEDCDWDKPEAWFGALVLGLLSGLAAWGLLP